jgi:hypothetical protein
MIFRILFWWLYPSILKDAVRYRYLRNNGWVTGKFVVTSRKNVRLHGVGCPALTVLDKQIDKELFY